MRVYYTPPIRPDELYHFGVIGMKWGVRRYQNYDGSYTKKGMEHYRESETNYNNAKKQYEVAKKVSSKNGYTTKDGTVLKGPKSVKQEAKQELKAAKRQLKADYKQLKRDKAGDQGKKLYQSGHTITSNQGKLQTAATIATVGGMATKYLYDSGNKQYAKYAAAVTIGAEAVTAILAGKSAYENSKLRAYYGHSRPRTNPGR